MMKILITGSNSYIGTSFEQWVKQWPDKYLIDTVDMIDGSWRDKDFSVYDVVYHVAGIAHNEVGRTSKEQEDLYYKVNYHLAVETAQKAKDEGVKQFIFMSSIIIYGESAGLYKKKIITKDTMPQPSNCYGDSKLKADTVIRGLESNTFKVVILRPPMIYGKGSKGNYPTLAHLSKRLPIFPNIKNERSMLHINNLCALIKMIIDNEDRGIYYPQNKEFINTSEMVKLIAGQHGRRIILTKFANPFIWFFSKVPGKLRTLANKAFGNLVYEKELSEYPNGDYRIVNLEESIKITER